ncbi:MAG: [methyl-Co(III) methanol/glycine betaine-specific corrinoid protein]:coenzyme methyltransferase [Methanolobus sp.]|nr:[methyl-Co(III) methanol/glycine betaine-specific corrinoid protein]:coenzyme methyltransferase [Methanolobus sp.]
MDMTGAKRPEADRNPEKMAQLAASLHDIAMFEIIRFPFDVTVLGEAMGCEIDPGTKARTPAVISHPLKDILRNPSEKINLPEDLLQRGRIPIVLEASKILREGVGLKVPIVAGLEGPAELASDLCGAKAFLKWTIQRPELVKAIVSMCTDACMLYANACLKAGADAVVIADAVASPDMIGPDIFRKFVKPELTRLAKNIDGHSIIHICGTIDSIIPDLLDCDFNAISADENVKDLKHVVDLAHKNNTVVIGNISTSDTLFNKKPEDVRKEAIDCLRSSVDILAPGCGVAPETSLENLLMMVKARDEYTT